MPSANATAPRERSSVLEFHMGQILTRVAATYPRLFEDGATMELVQNAIDSGAQNIWVRINLPKRLIVVQDDGNGASITDFDEALSSVGQSIKERNKLGQFGIGLVSPMGKCARFIFTSVKKPHSRGYHQWTFDCAAIQEMRNEITIPMVDLPNHQFSKSGQKGVPWRTEMRIEQFHKDLRVQRLTRDGLTRAIQERFSKAMERHDTVIHVAVTWDKDKVETWAINAESFRGTPLEKQRTRTSDFTLFLAVPDGKGNRKGVVRIGESDNDFRIDFATFLKRSAQGFLADDAAQAIMSGIFEGEIVNSKIRLNSDRTSFEINEALVDFCLEIESWFKQTGLSFVEEVQSASREERFQRLGIRSMKVLEELIGTNPVLKEFVSTFKRGTQGKAHTEVGEVIGKQDSPSISTHSASVSRTPSESKKDPTDEASGTHEHHVPYSVMGPKGHRRNVVRSDSLGLQFSYLGLEGSKRLWELDTRDGVITFNTRHPVWQDAEKAGDRCLMELQEFIAVQALHLEMAPEEWKPAMEMHIEDSLSSVIFLLLKADQIAGRRTIVQQLPAKKRP